MVNTAKSLTPFQVETIALFVNVASVLSVPRSVGEIYGLLFSTEEPLSLDDIIERLRISRGSASEGTRWLRSMGAIKTVYLAGVRKEHFTAEVNLRQLASGFLRDRLDPHLANGQNRLDLLSKSLSKNGSRSFESTRLGKIKNWYSFANKILPLVKTLAGKF
jgi:DNA-binding transcriptional regulator GbsR (MarR family)